MAIRQLPQFFAKAGGVRGVILPSREGVSSEASVTVMRALWQPAPPKIATPLETTLFSGWTQEGSQGSLAAQYLANQLLHQYGYWYMTAYADTKDLQTFYEEYFGLIEWIETSGGVLVASQRTLAVLWERGISKSP